MSQANLYRDPEAEHILDRERKPSSRRRRRRKEREKDRNEDTLRRGKGKEREEGKRRFLFQHVQQNPVSRSEPAASPRPPSAAAVLPD